MPASKVCKKPGCPAKATQRGACDTHARQDDRARGTRQQRGYNTEHDKLRRQWAPRVATGTVPCARCGHVIGPGQPWDLGHHDHDRTKYRGPEHVDCNRSAGGRAAHGLPPR